MKEWKAEIVQKLDREADDSRVIWFREFVKPMGYNHIHTGDVRDIITAFLKLRPDYEARHDVSNPCNSLFCGLVFAEKGMFD